MKIVVTAVIWIALLGGFWLILSAENIASWIIGLPFIALALLLQPRASNTSTIHGQRIKVIGLLRLAVFFIRESLRGGIDVSRRVMATPPRVNPGFFDITLRLQQPFAQKLLISSISLLPGTLCADRKLDRIHVHTLDREMDPAKDIQRLEALIADAFGETL